MTAQTYSRFTFKTASPQILMAFLWDYGFDSFQEEDDTLIAYLTEELKPAEVERRIRHEHNAYFDQLTVEQVVNENWNAQWEAAFDPVTVGDFCHVRASFHDPDGSVKYDLVIDPKMAFGTGHHETTYLMIEQMSAWDFSGKRVLDMGCGTGVLSILAYKMGAKDITAVDIDPLSVENTLENLAINRAAAKVVLGGSEAIRSSMFDIVLANINRVALEQMIVRLYDAVDENGIALISGILIEDRRRMEVSVADAGFAITNILERGEWICMELSKGGF